MFPSCHIAVITALMLSISGPVMAQSDGGPVWPTRTAEEMAVTPSPEVASLGGYTDPTVDLATGQGSLKYDLLQWDTGNYSLNIGLSYRIGAFTTEDEAGWVGLGWNLTGGGAVTRTVMGQPDEKQTLDIRTPQSLYEADNKEAVDYIKDLFDLRKDAMTDRYNYYFPGGSGSFIIRNGEIVQLPRSDNKIEIIGEVADKVRDFRVTVSDGTMYEFTEREMSEYRYRPESFNFSDPVPTYRAVTAWHLSRIITPEGGDTIRFSYAVMPQWTRNHNRPSETISMRDGDEHPKLQWLGSGMETGLTINETGIRNRRIIKSISSRTGRVEFTHTAPSQGSMYLSGARLCNFRNNVVKTVSFNRTTTSPELLSSFSISGNDGTLTAKEEFLYNGSGSGRYGDIFGYPNGTSVNGINSAIHPETGMLNPRRRPNFIYAQARALKKTISSLGVVTDYVYEPNSIPFTPRKPRLANRIRRDSLLLGIDPGDGGEPIRPWPADSTGTDDTPALNRHKFGAKEFVTDLGLNAFDFGARFYNPATAHWMAPDPLAGILSDPQTGESLKTPYLSNVSPTAYCAAEPVNLIDPTGMSPIYSTSGIFLGCSSEGFTGDIIIYLGDELFDFHRYTSEQLLTGRQWDFVLYDDFRNTNLMKPGAISNIWTHIIGYFNKLCVFDEVFSIDKIKGSIIRLQQRENANWATYLCSNSLPEIIGTNNYEYESTVENIASSLIVHEWYSHGMKGVLDNLKSHRLAYKAVINFKPFWKNTTECYKSFVLQRLYDYTVKETGKNQVDKPYRRLYYKYCKSKEL